MKSKEIFKILFSDNNAGDVLVDHYSEFKALKAKIKFMAKYLGALKGLEELIRNLANMPDNNLPDEVYEKLNAIDDVLSFDS